MADAQQSRLSVPEIPTGDYELDQLIRAYNNGGLDAEGEQLLREELAERNSGVLIDHAPNHWAAALDPRVDY